jgi:transcriptional regulator with XRE-family HTH domain
MSSSPAGIRRGNLRAYVAEEVRALMARRQVTAVELADRIGRSRTYVGRRLHGETAFDVDDLENIARVLAVEVADLMPPVKAATNAGWDSSSGKAASAATQWKRQTCVRVLPTNSRPARRITRPVSAIPAMRRRPMPVRPAA